MFLNGPFTLPALISNSIFSLITISSRGDNFVAVYPLLTGFEKCPNENPCEKPLTKVSVKSPGYLVRFKWYCSLSVCIGVFTS